MGGGARMSIALHAMWTWSGVCEARWSSVAHPCCSSRTTLSYLIGWNGVGRRSAPGWSSCRGSRRRAFGLTLTIGAASVVDRLWKPERRAPVRILVSRFVLAATIVMLAAVAFRASTTRWWPGGSGCGVRAPARGDASRHAGRRERGARERNYRVTVVCPRTACPQSSARNGSISGMRMMHLAPTSARTCRSRPVICGDIGCSAPAFLARTSLAGTVNQPQSGQRIVLMTDRRYGPRRRSRRNLAPGSASCARRTGGARGALSSTCWSSTSELSYGSLRRANGGAVGTRAAGIRVRAGTVLRRVS